MRLRVAFQVSTNIVFSINIVVAKLTVFLHRYIVFWAFCGDGIYGQARIQRGGAEPVYAP